MNVKELLMAASTSGGIGVIISAVFALFTQIDEVLPMDWFFDKFSSFSTRASAFMRYSFLLVYLSPGCPASPV